MLAFPNLSRKPALKRRRSTLDPTLRDSYENGDESSRARWVRPRREWSVSIDMLTNADEDALEAFVQHEAVYGANYFAMTDYERKTDNVYRVRFSTLPAYTDAGNIEGEFRQNCSFVVREV